MKTSLISSQSLWASPRTNLGKIQLEMANANKELVSGRSADAGLRLGLRTGTSLSVRQEMAFLKAIIDGNSGVKIRLDGAYSAADTIRSTAEKFAATVISTPLGDRNIESILVDAQSTFVSIIDNLNRSVNGEYVFGGANSAVKPIGEYTESSAAKTAADDAFQSYFGFAASDPSVASISKADLENFLEGPFKDLFNEASWKSNWSSASDNGIMTRVSENIVMNTSASANDGAYRSVAMGFSMLLDLGVAGMNNDARTLLLDRVSQTLLQGASDVSDLQSTSGQIKAKVTAGNDVIEAKLNIYMGQLVDMEGADPIEAKVKIDQLTTQLQMSYALTNQMRGLNLINYL